MGSVAFLVRTVRNRPGYPNEGPLDSLPAEFERCVWGSVFANDQEFDRAQSCNVWEERGLAEGRGSARYPQRRGVRNRRLRVQPKAHRWTLTIDEGAGGLVYEASGKATVWRWEDGWNATNRGSGERRAVSYLGDTLMPLPLDTQEAIASRGGGSHRSSSAIPRKGIGDRRVEG